MLRDHEIFENSHPAEETDILEGACDFCDARDLMVFHRFKRKIAARGMMQSDRTSARFIETGNAIERRGFPGTIRADNRCDVPALRFK